MLDYNNMYLPTFQIGVPLSVSLLPNRQVIVDVGKETEISCFVAGGKNPIVTWFKDAKPIIYSTHSTGKFSLLHR